MNSLRSKLHALSLTVATLALCGLIILPLLTVSAPVIAGVIGAAVLSGAAALSTMD